MLKWPQRGKVHYVISTSKVRRALDSLIAAAFMMLALMAVCECATPQYPGLEQARNIAWQSFAMRTVAPPVDVVTKLTCRNSPGPTMTGFGCYGICSGQCMAGMERSGPIAVAYVAGQPWSSTALCHEYLHLILESSFGDGDYAHARPEWSVQVPDCVHRLAENGL
jgi:hypothetical protein